MYDRPRLVMMRCKRLMADLYHEHIENHNCASHELSANWDLKSTGAQSGSILEERLFLTYLLTQMEYQWLGGV